jgi:catechol 2,3-dioxygenase-like lactoylglutathione lyase family enzyme
MEAAVSARIYGGTNIAMKVPPHEYDATVAFYRDVVGLELVKSKSGEVGFQLGPNRLWIDPVPGMSQAELWLELFCDDFPKAAARLAAAGVVRCDAIEALPQGFKGGWITSPANIVHMLREPDAW